MSARPPVAITMPRRAMLVLAAAALVVAGTAPGWAGPAARAVLVVAAVIVAAGGALMLATSVPFAGTSRFEPPTNRRERREVPPELETLTRAVVQSNAPGGRNVLDPVVLLNLRRVAVARLAGMHLDVHEPEDHTTIQRIVSPTMWSVLSAGPGGARTQHLPSLEVPSGALTALVDELERL